MISKKSTSKSRTKPEVTAIDSQGLEKKLSSPVSVASEPTKKSKTRSESRKEAKIVAVERKKQKLGGDIIDECKRLWEEGRAISSQNGLSMKDKKLEYERIVSLLLLKMKDRVQEIIFKHDSSRIVQFCIKQGKPSQRQVILAELSGSFEPLAMSKYGRFIVSSLLKYTSEARSMIRESIVRAGLIKKLILHKDGALIVEEIYTQYSNSAQKKQMLDSLLRKESVLYKDDPVLPKMFIDPLTKSLSYSVEKGTFGTCQLVHSLLLYLIQYYSMTDPTYIQNGLLDIVQDDLIKIIHTRDGSLAARSLLPYMPHKARKLLIKQFKGDVLLNTAKDSFAHLVLLSLFSCVDDTVLLDRYIISPLFSEQNIAELLQNNNAKKVILSVISFDGIISKYFAPETIRQVKDDVLDLCEKMGSSKKDAKARQSEICQRAIPLFVGFFMNQSEVASLASDHLACSIILELIFSSESQELASKVTDSILDSIISDDDNKKGMLIFLIRIVKKSHSNFMFKVVLERLVEKKTLITASDRQTLFKLAHRLCDSNPDEKKNIVSALFSKDDFVWGSDSAATSSQGQGHGLESETFCIETASWYPSCHLFLDKNRHRLEEATKEFTHLQKCYSILSDLQERRFYDIHRDQILRSGSSPTNEEDGTVFDLMPFFSLSAYKGFSDSSRGSFYNVYKKVFEDIEGEEERLFRTTRPDTQYSWTTFGNSTTPFLPTLKCFYDKWTRFSTLKSFFTVEKYSLFRAENRDHRRYLEKENKKHREDIRKEYNTTVRSLALFIKKRDPRVQAFNKEAFSFGKKVAEPKKARQPESSSYIPEAWTNIDEDQYQSYFNMYKDSEPEENLQGEDQGPEKGDVECVAIHCQVCNKTFKSESQWENHEKSKKHKKQVQAVREKFVEEQSDTKEEIKNVEHGEQDVFSCAEDESSAHEGYVQGSSSLESASESHDESEDESRTLEQELEFFKISDSSDSDVWSNRGNRKKKPASGASNQHKVSKNPERANVKHEACNTCGTKFSSRNALFQHIKVTDHAAHLKKK